MMPLPSLQTAGIQSGPTIGVFDSGFGGLTVLRALMPLIPAAKYLYLGDTARLPYGSKSQKTIARSVVASGRFLRECGAEHLVVACNTATALALDDLRAALPIPVTGVIAPGAGAAATLPGDHVLVLATSATVHSRAYTRELKSVGLRATEKACPLLVPLVEEGWLDASAQTAAVTTAVLRIYLEEARQEAPDASSLLLGCTHYPLLRPLIEATLERLDYPLQLVDAAEATARVVAAYYPEATDAGVARADFYATDSIEKFQRLGSRFLGHELPPVELVNLDG